MIYLHKLLPLALSPIVLVLVLMAWAAYRRSRIAALLSIALLYAASVPVLSDALFRAVEQQQVRPTAESVAPAQAIVVLSGMMRHVAGQQGVVAEWGGAADRFFGGVELYAAAKAPQLVFTGGLLPWQGQQEPEGQVLRRMALHWGVPDKAIMVSGAAQNTQQESAAVRQLLGPGVRQIVLVTSAFHMPRAQMTFEQAGFEVTAYPVDLQVAVKEGTPMDFLPDAEALRKTDIAVRELLGRLYYTLKSLL